MNSNFIYDCSINLIIQIIFIIQRYKTSQMDLINDSFKNIYPSETERVVLIYIHTDISRQSP